MAFSLPPGAGPLQPGTKHCVFEGKNGVKKIFTVTDGHSSDKCVFIRKFAKPPEKLPCTVCFFYNGVSLTHAEVKEAVDSQLSMEGDTKVSTIQYIPRNVIHGTHGLPNRWMVTVNSEEAALDIVRLGIVIRRKRIPVRPLDDVIDEEYQEYMKVVKLMEQEEKEQKNKHK